MPNAEIFEVNLSLSDMDELYEGNAVTQEFATTNVHRKIIKFVRILINLEKPEKPKKPFKEIVDEAAKKVMEEE